MCTNISMQRESDNDPVVSARTMDWAPERVPTVMNFVPRGQLFPEFDLQGEIKWTNKYGFVGMGHPDKRFSGFAYTDGLNEEGLSAAALEFTASQYQEPEQGKGILYHLNVVNYVLGNFRRVSEVKKDLSELTICEAPIPLVISTKVHLHYIITDACGDHLIVEFINGKMKTYTNKIGNLTNDPPYEWHMNNLMNYLNLNLGTNPKLWNGESLYGNGQFGSPGDPTSTSRFVRSSLLTQCTYRPKNTQQSISLAQAILETLSVPLGTVMINNSGTDYDWTQWSIVRDHTHRSLYFYTDFNSRLYGIHLDRLDFQARDQKQLSIEIPEWYEDMTDVFNECP